MLAVTLFAVFSIPGLGHRPAITRGSCDDDFGSSATALVIQDAAISWSFQHYIDCTHRAVWLKWTNPYADSKMYVGVGIPPVARFDALRADAVLIGPGLPQLSEEDVALIPEEVRNDPAWTSEMGAYFHRSPADQSTCDHLGATLSSSTTVKNGRCDFYEPYGQTNSWRVLDADLNNIPVNGAEYYIAVWFQEPTSGKLGIAMGTWKEDFFTPMDKVTPSCVRDMTDYSEKYNEQPEDFPVIQCAGTSVPQSDGHGTAPPSCPTGQVWDTTPHGGYKVTIRKGPHELTQSREER
jgi:hypothetical protein